MLLQHYEQRAVRQGGWGEGVTHFASGNLGKLQGEGLSLAGEGRVCWMEKIEQESACVLLKKPLLARRPSRCQSHLETSGAKVEGLGVGR